ncbi:IclR family transcriptional regulator [Anaerohalosphaera lusitana]|nr:IclR family transcriptional regulator [Anaerohalosphaera lusitana]
MNGNGESSKYHVPNLERALEILELLSEHGEGLSLTSVVEKLGYPKNSVFRITKTLLDRGYLRRADDTKVFTLTHKMLTLGYGAVSEYSLVEKSLDIMRELRDEVRETVLIGILSGTYGVVLEQVVGSHLFKFMVNPGRRFPLHASAPGKAMWAFLPAREREMLLERVELKRYNDNTITDKGAMHEELDRVREAGYAIDRAEEVEGVRCVGAAVLDQHGYPVASIWSTGPSERMEKAGLEEAGRKTVEYARQISRRLGYGPAQ